MVPQGSLSDEEGRDELRSSFGPKKMGHARARREEKKLELSLWFSSDGNEEAAEIHGFCLKLKWVVGPRAL